MGNWNINIQGVGQHHNGSTKDANVIAAALVKQLRDAGQNIESATFTSGGCEHLYVSVDSPPKG